MTNKLGTIQFSPNGSDRPANMRKPGYSSSNKGGGRSFQPRNDKAIMFQCLLKAAVELRKTQGGIADPGLPFLLKECVDAASANLVDACKAAGVQ